MRRAKLDIVSQINFSTATKSMLPSFCSYKFGIAIDIVRNIFCISIFNNKQIWCHATNYEPTQV